MLEIFSQEFRFNLLFFSHQQLLDCLAPGADMDDSTCHCHYRGYTEDADYVVIGKNSALHLTAILVLYQRSFLTTSFGYRVFWYRPFSITVNLVPKLFFSLATCIYINVSKYRFDNSMDTFESAS